MNQQETAMLGNHNTATLRIIPKRVEAMAKRLQRFLQEGWDINGLASMQDDARVLMQVCVNENITEPTESLQTLLGLLDNTIEQQELPDPNTGERLHNLMEALQIALPTVHEDTYETFSGTERVGENSLRAEIPPTAFWRRWGTDAPAAKAVQEHRDVFKDEPAAQKQNTLEDNDPWSNQARHHGSHGNTVTTQSVADHDFSDHDFAGMLEPSSSLQFETTSVSVPSSAALPSQIPKLVTKAAPVIASAPAASSSIDANTSSAHKNDLTKISKLSVPSDFRIYHLTAYGPLSLALDQYFEAQQLELELVEDIAELKELLSALPADLVLIDAEFGSQLEAFGQDTRAYRQKQSRKLKVVALSDVDDIALRLSARRAGVDALIVGAKTIEDIVKRLRSMFEQTSDVPYRIMIAEDDRSQALFAEGILRNSGMETLVVLDGLDVMPALEQFQPDLILMDLHMPGANGIELTALIREQEAFVNTPIVFLSGENDEDRQFDAIDAGGDDFLSKPIRPRHLISAVQNRVRRHRATENRQQKRSGKDMQTGLYSRPDLLSLINQHLQRSGEKSGGILLLELEGLSSLRERFGIAAFEQLQSDVVRLLSQLLSDCPMTRFGDGSYLIYVSQAANEEALRTMAVQSRNGVVQHSFKVQEQTIRLRALMGICAFKHHFNDSGAMLNAVETVTRVARTQDNGVSSYEPPVAEDTIREAALLKQVREAIEQHALELLYQPVVAVAGSDDTQYQTLLRLRDKNGELLPAAEVIPMAERNDLIVDIDRWVLLQALALIRSRRAEQRPMRLFVTQSPLTLADNSQSEWLRAELEDNDVPGASLVIELRMEDASVHAGTVRQFCDSLVSLGVQFCLSQFELNAETERLLEQLPLGFVKLARKYSAGIHTQSTRDELKTLIDRAHRRGLEVIGTGVEDPQAAATLWMSGIDFIQGNLVQRADSELDFDFQQAVL